MAWFIDQGILNFTFLYLCSLKKALICLTNCVCLLEMILWFSEALKTVNLDISVAVNEKVKFLL